MKGDPFHHRFIDDLPLGVIRAGLTSRYSESRKRSPLRTHFFRGEYALAKGRCAHETGERSESALGRPALHLRTRRSWVRKRSRV